MKATLPTCTDCRKRLSGPFFRRKDGDFCGGCYEARFIDRDNVSPAPPVMNWPTSTPTVKRERAPEVARVCEACLAIERGMAWIVKEKGGLRHTPTEPEPTMEQLQQWTFDSVCEATDGCEVEPDGRCTHGHASWLLVLGLI